MASEHSPYYQRHSLRLTGYDYAQPGAYFATICVQHRLLLLEPIPVREMIERWWAKLPEKYPSVELDELVVMPNHIHGIIVITGDEPSRTPVSQDRRVSLATVMQWFKTMTTNEYIRGVKCEGWRRFDGQLWQRAYWDHIIRNEGDLARLRDYIRTNPARWMQDSLHA